MGIETSWHADQNSGFQQALTTLMGIETQLLILLTHFLYALTTLMGIETVLGNRFLLGVSDGSHYPYGN